MKAAKTSAESQPPIVALQVWNNEFHGVGSCPKIEGPTRWEDVSWVAETRDRMCRVCRHLPQRLEFSGEPTQVAVASLDWFVQLAEGELACGTPSPLSTTRLVALLSAAELTAHRLSGRSDIIDNWAPLDKLASLAPQIRALRTADPAAYAAALSARALANPTQNLGTNRSDSRRSELLWCVRNGMDLRHLASTSTANTDGEAWLEGFVAAAVAASEGTRRVLAAQAGSLVGSGAIGDLAAAAGLVSPTAATKACVVPSVVATAIAPAWPGAWVRDLGACPVPPADEERFLEVLVAVWDPSSDGVPGDSNSAMAMAGLLL